MQTSNSNDCDCLFSDVKGRLAHSITASREVKMFRNGSHQTVTLHDIMLSDDNGHQIKLTCFPQFHSIVKPYIKMNKNFTFNRISNDRL